MAKRADAEALHREIAARPGVTTPWDRISVTRVRFDTCARPPCVVWQWVDDNDKSVVRWAATGDLCPAHTTAGKDEALWRTVQGENARKNKTLGSARGVALLDADAVITWEFDNATRVIDAQERLLTVTVPGITQQTATQIQAAVDIRFGPGVVTIERG